MSLLNIILTLAIVGFLTWLIVTYVPMLAPFKTVIVAVVVIVLVLWILNGLGLMGTLNAPIRAPGK